MTILTKHCYSLRNSSKPHENAGISKDEFALYGARLVPDIFVVLEHEACTWSSCAGRSLTLLFCLWTVQRQKKASVVFLYVVPSFIMYISNPLSLGTQTNRNHTLFTVAFLICLNKVCPTIVNVWGKSELTGVWPWAGSVLFTYRF